MPINESSDELNPAVLDVEAPSAKPRAARSAKDYLALTIATCGVGYLPLAPGTWGSLLAVAFYVNLHKYWFPDTHFPPAFLRTYHSAQLIIILTLIVAGTWAASRTEEVLGKKDPGKVVIDEVAGQLIALLVLPGGMWRRGEAMTLLAAFILFRIFDIVKPYPARKLESLRGGFGIMADDLVAGVYAGLGALLLKMVWFG